MRRHRSAVGAALLTVVLAAIAGCGSTAEPVAAKAAAVSSASEEAPPTEPTKEKIKKTVTLTASPPPVASTVVVEPAAAPTSAPEPDPVPPPKVALNPDDFLHGTDTWWVRFPTLGWDCEISTGTFQLDCVADYDEAIGTPELAGPEALETGSDEGPGIREGFAGILEGEAYYGASSGEASVFAYDELNGGPGRGPDLPLGETLTMASITCQSLPTGFVCVDGAGAGVQVLTDSYLLFPRDGAAPAIGPQS